MDSLISTLASPIPFIILISVVITVHELGHYWAGRAFNAAAESFAVGFGRPIFEVKDKRGDFAAVALERGLITGLKTRREVEEQLIEIVGENEEFSEPWTTYLVAESTRSQLRVGIAAPSLVRLVGTAGAAEAGHVVTWLSPAASARHAMVLSNARARRRRTGMGAPPGGRTTPKR